MTVVGCFWESLDIASGISAANNVIGALILASAVLPIVLLLLPRRCERASASAAKAR